ncbi:Sodium-dependent glucose transporter-like protein 1 [Leptotrombidium deliense]|uniref:Sodium-dependent glucose transporter-like protein 1 n=1 Tax=Leptotrombidium deliense TaxID=299467 RepID=A0A443SAQ6_9ACAR|nr:Sodium-dependent glucose transporter-like protein 1 [Leptotrombidium deliense]
MVVSPLTFNPFLSNVESEEHGHFCGQSDLNVTVNVTKTELPFGELHKSQIWMPHVVIGILMAVIAYCCVILECRRIKLGRKDNVDKRQQETLSLKNDEEEAKESESKCYRITFIMLSCSLIAIFWGYVCSYLQFWVTFVMFSKLNISKSKAVMMMTAISLSMAIGGFVGLLASMRIRPMRMLAMLNVFLVVADSILLLGVDRSELLLWIGGVMCSFVFGNYYVSVYNLLQERVGITNLIGCMFTVSAYLLTAFGLPVLLANFIECTPIVFLYYTSSSIAASILLFLALYFTSCGQKRRKVEQNEPEASEVKETPKRIYRRKYSSRRMSVAGVAL